MRSPCLYLHCAANKEAAPVLQIIFTQSFKDQSLPSDWLMANMVPIFKKAIAIAITLNNHLTPNTNLAA